MEWHSKMVKRLNKKNLFLKGRISVETILWKGMENPRGCLHLDWTISQTVCGQGTGRGHVFMACNKIWAQSRTAMLGMFGGSSPTCRDPSWECKLQVVNTQHRTHKCASPGPKNCNREPQLWKTLVKKTAYDSLPNMQFNYFWQGTRSQELSKLNLPFSCQF